MPRKSAPRRFEAISLLLALTCTLVCDSMIVKYRDKYDLSFERGLLEKGYDHVIGCDESGRGSIAGPVVAVACCVSLRRCSKQEEVVFGESSSSSSLVEVKDSKLLSSDERAEIHDRVFSRPETYSFRCARRSNEHVDAFNVSRSTMDAFKESIQRIIVENDLSPERCYCVVDGNRSPKLDDDYRGVVPCRPYVGADREIYTVALASIIAKTTLDRFMKEEAHALYPHYDFPTNLGYSTKDHIRLIHKHGPSPLHRKSFKALRNR